MGGRKGKRNRADNSATSASDAPASTQSATQSDPTSAAAPLAAEGPKLDSSSSMSQSQVQGARKKQKREEYLSTLASDKVELPKKKFYRQRAHANPFSDHSLT
jgi:hypothetical protein